MSESITRRLVLAGSALLLPDAAWAQSATPWRVLEELEKQTGARIGVMAIDGGNGHALFYRENERFLLCSTFKFLLAAAVLARVDAGSESLTRVVDGKSIAALCEAAMTVSDNSAANVLLATVGGPAGLTGWLRGMGDATTRLDRTEPALNLAEGENDTTTPVAMAGNMKAILLGEVLKPASRTRLLGWLAGNTTGGAMLKAGLPAGWQVGDKTGRGQGGETNDIAIVTPPPSSDSKPRKPILIAAYTMGGKGSDADRAATVAAVGRLVASSLA